VKVCQLDNQVSVSGQIEASDVPALCEAGAEIIVCNRPDREAENQPDFSAIEAACRKQGIQACQLAFSGDQIEEAQVAAMLELLSGGRKLHAYCRSGARSSKLWARARRHQGLSADLLVRRAADCGFDVSRHILTTDN